MYKQRTLWKALERKEQDNENFRIRPALVSLVKDMLLWSIARTVESSSSQMMVNLYSNLEIAVQENFCKPLGYIYHKNTENMFIYCVWQLKPSLKILWQFRDVFEQNWRKRRGWRKVVLSLGFACREMWWSSKSPCMWQEQWTHQEPRHIQQFGVEGCFTGNEDFKLEKGPTDKAKEPDPGGSDQQNLGYKKLKNWPYRMVM